ncbi:hypothetical protein [Silanimonas sp.]|jgi:hypothetical protein|uniref:hypothetical protein n=1 Tax=Silanimonas sp. TaxID=1929290 RepID=UPI0022BE68D8|nr:hypothetical protein [Silanimonas sp.]MCZ8165773.1 hypothetical protein [Silanimonas sp.]
MTADIDTVQEGRTEAEVRAERRLALSLAATKIKAGEQLPQRLRGWLAGRLLQLHAALEAGGESVVKQALVELGRKPRGNSPSGVALVAAKSVPDSERKGRRRPTTGGRKTREPVDPDEQDLGLAAAVRWISARLKSTYGAHVIPSIAIAMGLSEDTVEEAVEVVRFDAGNDAELLALATPVLERLQNSIAQEPEQHSQRIRDLVRKIARS